MLPLTNKTGLLQNFLANKSLFAAPPCILCQKNGTRLKGITHLKGELYGNPTLQGGERTLQARPSGRRHLPERQSLKIMPIPRLCDIGGVDIPAGGAVFQTGCLSSHPPGLKAGVTTNNALQTGYIFQMCNEDKMNRGCCLSC